MNRLFLRNLLCCLRFHRKLQRGRDSSALDALVRFSSQRESRLRSLFSSYFLTRALFRFVCNVQLFTREKPVDSVVAPEKKKTGIFGGLFSSNSAKSKAEDDEEDKDFEGFSFHGDGSGKSVLD
jgi:hypothetical protein